MLLRPFLNDTTSCASYLFGCGTHAKLAGQLVAELDRGARSQGFYTQAL
jgi:hypothetical protein